ncbi:hypothetical protein HOH87_06775, partial [bacterium]|nr:hypothetical protein [bacterium]
NLKTLVGTVSDSGKAHISYTSEAKASLTQLTGIMGNALVLKSLHEEGLSQAMIDRVNYTAVSRSLLNELGMGDLIPGIEAVDVSRVLFRAVNYPKPEGTLPDNNNDWKGLIHSDPNYVKFVDQSNQFGMDPADINKKIKEKLPVIEALNTLHHTDDLSSIERTSILEVFKTRQNQAYLSQTLRWMGSSEAAQILIKLDHLYEGKPKKVGLNIITQIPQREKQLEIVHYLIDALERDIRIDGSEDQSPKKAAGLLEKLVKDYPQFEGVLIRSLIQPIKPKLIAALSDGRYRQVMGQLPMGILPSNTDTVMKDIRNAIEGKLPGKVEPAPQAKYLANLPKEKTRVQIQAQILRDSQLEDSQVELETSIELLAKDSTRLNIKSKDALTKKEKWNPIIHSLESIVESAPKSQKTVTILAALDQLKTDTLQYHERLARLNEVLDTIQDLTMTRNDQTPVGGLKLKGSGLFTARGPVVSSLRSSVQEALESKFTPKQKADILLHNPSYSDAFINDLKEPSVVTNLVINIVERLNLDTVTAETKRNLIRLVGQLRKHSDYKGNTVFYGKERIAESHLLVDLKSKELKALMQSKGLTWTQLKSELVQLGKSVAEASRFNPTMARSNRETERHIRSLYRGNIPELLNGASKEAIRGFEDDKWAPLILQAKWNTILQDYRSMPISRESIEEIHRFLKDYNALDNWHKELPIAERALLIKWSADHAIDKTSVDAMSYVTKFSLGDDFSGTVRALVDLASNPTDSDGADSKWLEKVLDNFSVRGEIISQYLQNRREHVNEVTYLLAAMLEGVEQRAPDNSRIEPYEVFEKYQNEMDDKPNKPNELMIAVADINALKSILISIARQPVTDKNKDKLKDWIGSILTLRPQVLDLISDDTDIAARDRIMDVLTKKVQKDLTDTPGLVTQAYSTMLHKSGSRMGSELISRLVEIGFFHQPGADDEAPVMMHQRHLIRAIKDNPEAVYKALSKQDTVSKRKLFQVLHLLPTDSIKRLFSPKYTNVNDLEAAFETTLMIVDDSQRNKIQEIMVDQLVGSNLKFMIETYPQLIESSGGSLDLKALVRDRFITHTVSHNKAFNNWDDTTKLKAIATIMDAPFSEVAKLGPNANAELWDRLRDQVLENATNDVNLDRWETLFNNVKGFPVVEMNRLKTWINLLQFGIAKPGVVVELPGEIGVHALTDLSHLPTSSRTFNSLYRIVDGINSPGYLGGKPTHYEALKAMIASRAYVIGSKLVDMEESEEVVTRPHENDLRGNLEAIDPDRLEVVARPHQNERLNTLTAVGQDTPVEPVSHEPDIEGQMRALLGTFKKPIPLGRLNEMLYNAQFVDAAPLSIEQGQQSSDAAIPLYEEQLQRLDERFSSNYIARRSFRATNMVTNSTRVPGIVEESGVEVEVYRQLITSLEADRRMLRVGHVQEAPGQYAPKGLSHLLSVSHNLAQIEDVLKSSEGKLKAVLMGTTQTVRTLILSGTREISSKDISGPLLVGKKHIFNFGNTHEIKELVEIKDGRLIFAEPFRQDFPKHTTVASHTENISTSVYQFLNDIVREDPVSAKLYLNNILTILKSDGSANHYEGLAIKMNFLNRVRVMPVFQGVTEIDEAIDIVKSRLKETIQAVGPNLAHDESPRFWNIVSGLISESTPSVQRMLLEGMKKDGSKEARQIRIIHNFNIVRAHAIKIAQETIGDPDKTPTLYSAQAAKDHYEWVQQVSTVLSQVPDDHQPHLMAAILFEVQNTMSNNKLPPLKESLTKVQSLLDMAETMSFASLIPDVDVGMIAPKVFSESIIKALSRAKGLPNDKGVVGALAKLFRHVVLPTQRDVPGLVSDRMIDNAEKMAGKESPYVNQLNAQRSLQHCIKLLGSSQTHQLHQTMRRLNPGVARDIERISIALKTESASVSEEVIS